MTQELKVCPWCRKMPEVYPKNWRVEGGAFGQVRCENRRCSANPVVNDGALVNDNRGSDAYKAAAIRRWNTRPREDALEAEVEALRGANDLLTWLHGQEQLELSWDSEGDLSECSWRVHSVSGGINDREWRLIATGDTPAEALANARTALGDTQ